MTPGSPLYNCFCCLDLQIVLKPALRLCPHTEAASELLAVACQHQGSQCEGTAHGPGGAGLQGLLCAQADCYGEGRGRGCGPRTVSTASRLVCTPTEGAAWGLCLLALPSERTGVRGQLWEWLGLPGSCCIPELPLQDVPWLLSFFSEGLGGSILVCCLPGGEGRREGRLASCASTCHWARCGSMSARGLALGRSWGSLLPTGLEQAELDLGQVGSVRTRSDLYLIRGQGQPRGSMTGLLTHVQYRNPWWAQACVHRGVSNRPLLAPYAHWPSALCCALTCRDGPRRACSSGSVRPRGGVGGQSSPVTRGPWPG